MSHIPHISFTEVNKDAWLMLFPIEQRHSIHGMMEEENVIRPHQEIAQLSCDEKKFLLAVERGDVASTRRWVPLNNSFRLLINFNHTINLNVSRITEWISKYENNRNPYQETVCSFINKIHWPPKQSRPPNKMVKFA